MKRWPGYYLSLVCSVLVLQFSSRAEAAENRRPVVVEQFTAAWCPYCYSVGLGLDRIYSQTSRKDVIILGYHDDRFSTTLGDQFFNLMGVGGIPCVWFNGHTSSVGGWDVSSGEAGILDSYNTLNSKIQAERTRIVGTTPFVVILLGNFTPTNPSFDVYILATGSYPNLVNLHVLALEDHVPFYASNGQTEFNFLLRENLKTQTLDLRTPQAVTIGVNYAGTVSCANTSRVYPVVILRDTVTKEIVGASATFGSINAVRPSNWSSYR